MEDAVGMHAQQHLCRVNVEEDHIALPQEVEELSGGRLDWVLYNHRHAIEHDRHQDEVFKRHRLDYVNHTAPRLLRVQLSQAGILTAACVIDLARAPHHASRRRLVVERRVRRQLLLLVLVIVRRGRSVGSLGRLAWTRRHLARAAKSNRWAAAANSWAASAASAALRCGLLDRWRARREHLLLGSRRDGLRVCATRAPRVHSRRHLGSLTRRTQLRKGRLPCRDGGLGGGYCPNAAAIRRLGRRQAAAPPGAV